MTIASLCNRFSATLLRQASSASSTGMALQTWSTGNRAGNPTSVNCEMQVMDTEERIEFGIDTTDIAWCMYTSTDPVLTTLDRVDWTDENSVARECRVDQASFGMAGRARIWKTVVCEKRNRK